MIFRNLCASLVLMLVMPGMLPAAECDFLPPAPQPEWTFESPAIEGFYTGVGLSEQVAGGGADEQIEKARQNALNDLASSIEVSVKSSLRVDIRQQKSGDDAITDQDVQQITETITDTSLQDVVVDQTWLDRKRCIVWVRVKIARSTVDTMQRREYEAARLVKLDTLYDRARDQSASAEQRGTALKLAYGLLNEIDFSLLRGKQSKAYYQRMLDSLSKSVEQSLGSQQAAEKLRQQAEELLLQAGNTTSPDKRKQLRVDAIAKLREIIADNPIGEREGFFAAEAAAFRIAEVEKARNNACEAQLQYEIVRDRSASKQWVDKADELLRGVKCTRANQKDRLWRRAFDGVRTSFACASDVQGAIGDWDKPCENLESFLKGHGALSGVDTGLKTAQIVDLAYQLDKNDAAASAIRDKGRVLVFVAEGKLKQRKNPDNPMGQDYQFSGKIYSYVVNNGKVEFRDKFTGTGGWNPVSEEMALEVVGLNVAKRWQSQYLKQFKNN